MQDTITVSHLAQAGLTESLEMYGGRWTVKTGFDLGDYLVTAPGVAEVVTVWQDRDNGDKRYHCTCEFDLFDAGTQDTGACTHIGLVAIFLNINLTALAGDLGRAVLRMRRLAAKGADPALQAAATARAGLLSFVYHQRKAATVRRMPYRPAAPSEGAAAPSLVGADDDDLSDMAALFASHTCACGAHISAEASACSACDPGQYESDRLFDLAPSPAAWFAPRPVVAAPAAFQALIADLCGPVAVAA